MGILPQPVEKGFLTLFGGEIGNRPSTNVEVGIADVRRVPFWRKWGSVPCPMCERTKRKLFFINRRKGLETRNIGGESKFAVSNGQRRKGVKLMYHRIMPTNDGFAIYLLCHFCMRS